MQPADGPTTTVSPRAGLLRLAGGTLVLKVTGQGLLLVVMVVLARLLGDRAYGQYIYALAWLRICVLLVKAGYDTALLRFLPAYALAGKWALARGLLRTAVIVTLSAWLVVALGAVAALAGLSDRLEPGLAPTLLLAVGVVLVQALVEQGMAALRSWNRPLLAVLPNFVLRPLLDVAPNWRHPVKRESARKLWQRIAHGWQGQVLRTLAPERRLARHA